MEQTVFLTLQEVHPFESEELREVKRFFEWAQSYERQGLSIAANALRGEGNKALLKFLMQGKA